MTPQELKNSILQMAIQGKLVEQRAEEGTAQALLTLIQDEKRQLVSTGRIKKDKQIDTITDEDKPYDIPDSWCLLKIGSVCQLLDGEKKTGIALPCLDAKYLRGKDEAVLQASGKYVDAGAKIILVDGENSGEVFCAPVAGFMGSTFKELFIVSALDEKYVLYFFQLKKQELRNNKRGAAIPHLNKELFYGFALPIPPLAEQRRIVAKIESLLPLIDRYEKAWTRLEEFNKRFPGDMQKSLLQMAIQGKLVEQRPEEGTGEELYRQIQQEKARLVREGRIKKEKPLPEIAEDEVPFEVPETWKWVRLRDAAQVVVDCPHSTPKYYDYDTGYYAIGTKCMNGKGEISQLFNTDEETYLKRIERLEPTEKDIVYSREGSIVCRAVILPRDKRICLGQRVMLIRGGEHILPEYLQQYLMCEHTVSYLTQGYKGVGVKHINVADVCALPIPLPPLAEQKRIVARLEELLPLCERLK